LGIHTLGDWAWGPILDQTPFQALEYAPGSPADRVGPTIGPTASNDADDDSAGHFANDAFKDDDSP